MHTRNGGDRMKKKIVSKLGLTVLALMMGVVLLQPMATMAKGNVKDKYFYVAYNGDGGDAYFNNSRAKWDYTSCYVYNTSGIGILTNVMATDRDCEGYGYNVLADCSAKAYFGVAPGEAKFVDNYVKERGYGYCTIKFAPLSHDRATYTGWWSPDSIR